MRARQKEESDGEEWTEKGRGGRGGVRSALRRVDRRSGSDTPYAERKARRTWKRIGRAKTEGRRGSFPSRVFKGKTDSSLYLAEGPDRDTLFPHQALLKIFILN